AHIGQAEAEERLLKELPRPEGGHFIAPTVIRVRGIADLGREIFGPVLHLATFNAEDLPRVLADITATGYGLTFGLHSRIDNRVQEVTEALAVGNIYVNRNQIGAVVGCQPFGGEGLSGTGPKAGGPQYLPRFTAPPRPAPLAPPEPAPPATATALASALAACPPAPALPERDLPGPTGESNRLLLQARAPLLCLGPGTAAAAAQAEAVRKLGGRAVEVPAALAPEALATLDGFSGVLWWGGAAEARAYAQVLAAREGPILPLIGALPDLAHVAHERVICIDTTASGGNAALLAGAGTA
ncbi:aldehyde dehydrogenase family protein, partial [Phaeovulum sp.]|uniref:aldehyde dehydrogenase family protein n=1 Tax=Phaeovulum sp. TaxID=2934796 RepID=UPI003565E3F1